MLSFWRQEELRLKTGMDGQACSFMRDSVSPYLRVLHPKSQPTTDQGKDTASLPKLDGLFLVIGP